MDLGDFGAVNTPRIQRGKRLRLGTRTTGHIARDLRDGAQVYVSERDTDTHRYHGEDPWYDFPFEGPGYGLSLELFSALDRRDIGRVYIAETDTGDLHQFAFHQFVNGHVINYEDEAQGRGYEKDIQKVVPLSDAVETWDAVYPGALVKARGFR